MDIFLWILQLRGSHFENMSKPGHITATETVIHLSTAWGEKKVRKTFDSERTYHASHPALWLPVDAQRIGSVRVHLQNWTSYASLNQIHTASKSNMEFVMLCRWIATIFCPAKCPHPLYVVWIQRLPALGLRDVLFWCFFTTCLDCCFLKTALFHLSETERQ